MLHAQLQRCAPPTMRFSSETGAELLVLHSRAPLQCLSCGSESKFAVGDRVGNIYC